MARDGVRDAVPGWIVELTFTRSGQTKFTNLTKDAAANHHQQVAIVAGKLVVTVPSVTAIMMAGTEINDRFTQAEAQALAARLRQATLPLTFSVESVEET